MRCPKCGNDNPGQARFCRSCGEKLIPESQSAFAPRVLTPEERSRRLLEDAFRLAEEGRLQSAIQSCQQAISLNPTSTSAHSLLGTLFERVGDRDGAIREYEQVLTLSPGSTVERRRLNELMGVAAAPEAIAISPRTTRMAITSGFVVLALVLVGAIIFTTQQPRPARQTAVRPAMQAAQVGTQAAPAAFGMAPPRLATFGRARPSGYGQPRVAPQPMQQRPQVAQGFGYLGPGAWTLTGGGGEAYGGMASQRRYAAPVQGAVPYRAVAGPTINTPGAVYYPAGYTAATTVAPAPARNYYFQGNYQQSIEAYRSYLAQNPQAAEPREELAWVYTESGNYQQAQQEYRAALDQYRSELERGHNIEAAKHGVRTCESAIRALETQ